MRHYTVHSHSHRRFYIKRKHGQEKVHELHVIKHLCVVIFHPTRWHNTELWRHGWASVSQPEASPRVSGSVSERSAAGLGCLLTDTDPHRLVGASVLQQRRPGSCCLSASPDGTVRLWSAHGEANCVPVKALLQCLLRWPGWLFSASFRPHSLPEYIIPYRFISLMLLKTCSVDTLLFFQLG